MSWKTLKDDSSLLRVKAKGKNKSKYQTAVQDKSLRMYVVRTTIKNVSSSTVQS